MADGYSEDFHAWALAQADALRRRSPNEVDWENIAEEIESLGKSEARELRSHLLVLCTHLLKWIFQADRRSPSWEISIKTQREDAADLLAENLSLKPRRSELFAAAYKRARLQATLETELPEAIFPETPPFDVDEAMDPTFWPNAAV